jgi:hypothetical protein
VTRSREEKYLEEYTIKKEKRERERERKRERERERKRERERERNRGKGITYIYPPSSDVHPRTSF